MNNPAKILIIIVTWNKQQYVIDLLKSITKLNYANDAIDVLVVDNASTDDTVALLREQFPDIHLICNEENIGGTGGFNTGLSWAFENQNYDYLWLLDNDVQVNKNALIELVNVLDDQPDIAVVGSTMMQLDYPDTINEMGAFVDLNNGRLLFNRHHEKLQALAGVSVESSLDKNIDLSDILENCQPSMDVDYVAAASLLIRADVAKDTGLWDDFFIHFDDVEWCLRIARRGHRIAVSARSIIWHLSAAAKVPSWILYYDNRNILYLLEQHGQPGAIAQSQQLSLKKSLYYRLIGKKDLSELHTAALDDYSDGIKGKKDIQLDKVYYSFSDIEDILTTPTIKRILLPWTVNLQSNGLQQELIRLLRKQSNVSIDFLAAPARLENASTAPPRQIPGVRTISAPAYLLPRLWFYWRMRKQYDLVMQSDYQTIIPLSWLADKVLFINNEDLSLRDTPNAKDCFNHFKELFSRWRAT